MTSNITNIIRIQQYLKGELSPEEMNKLEREALDDPFLNDALEGYLQKGVNTQHLTLLQQRLQNRITEQPQERNRMLFTSQRLGIAAVACLLFVLACVLLWMVNTRNTANKTNREVTVELNTGDPIPSGNGLSIARKLTASSASPAAGWDHFNDYIAKKAKSNMAKGVIVLRFQVNQQGRPFNIQVIKGTEYSQLNEIKQLLKGGPAWEANKSGEVEFVFE
ncbi:MULTISPECIES: energy transducer TonB [Olivibacter]|jgi:hypothetical protein|uniref:Energy transducer TonB n=1 Tax=Olivibacter oleidegradans TaxID=760123 RepID=A0ABV6HF18_9SPHI|nr:MULTISPECIES: hypothetical protein [Olivibacter]MDM8177514.1 hypothetical protein [Olivibacter sp. 47]QEK99963.1 hypothetical protein FKG96_03805 [Olivibacter sp. LS-1]